MKDYFELVTKTVMWVLGVIAIYMLLLKISGHSPALESILAIIIGIMGTNLLFVNYKMGKMEGKLELIDSRVQESFSHVKEEFAHVRKDLTYMKRRA